MQWSKLRHDIVFLDDTDNVHGKRQEQLEHRGMMDQHGNKAPEGLSWKVQIQFGDRGDEFTIIALMDNFWFHNALS